ncbi:MAG TPA: TIGR03618 family F420-dependent PPOX class oxidoreductase [Marmoricola sp.]|nr:TIGR03618 family F420-dependent PPOX class oxidoreductase [Marmoricola sp.]
MANIKDLVPESHHDLLDAAWAMALVTIDSKGRPQTTAVWYLADPDDGQFKTSTSDARVKFKHMQANPEVDVFIVDPANMFRSVEIRGTVAITLDEGLVTAGKIGAKYSADVTNFDQPGDQRYSVVIEPRKVVVNG